ncbi:MAG TPA: winged helix-turn-helix domain-containing protein [Pyrinomonadaceae bacterium]
MSKRVKHIYEFGPFKLDLEERRVLGKGNETLNLAPKVFETLLLLIERRGNVITKKEMMNVLWPDRYVEEANLSQNIFLLRKALGESQNEGRYIETVPKRGYRFAMPVIEIQEEVGPDITPREAEPTPDVKENPARRRAQGVTSLAVLPAIIEGSDPNLEYLAAGICDTIIISLAQLPQLNVISRSLVSRYKGREINAQEVGRELAADTVLVSRFLSLGTILIITVELVEVSTGWQLWGEQYHRSFADILKLQDELATTISEQLLIKLTKEEKKRLGRHYTQDPEAYQAYLKGRYHWNRHCADGYEKAIECFLEAIALDPSYALAYSALANSYVLFDFYGLVPPLEIGPKAKNAAMNALLLDDTLAEAHLALACVKMMYERAWSEAEREFLRAIELDPNYAQARNWYSHFLMAMGRIEESLTQSQLALKLDPLDDSINHYLGWHYIHARQFDRAISQLEKTLANNPEFFLARVTLGMAYVQKAEFEKGIAELTKAAEQDRLPVVLGFLGHAYGMASERDAALQILEELEDLARRTYVPPYSIGLIHAALGEQDEAFEWFEKAYAAQNEWLNWLKVTPEVDSLRADPRFTTLCRKLKLIPDQAA